MVKIHVGTSFFADCKIVVGGFVMAERQKRPKMVFRRFLDDSRGDLKKFGNSKGEKYVREAWMLRASPALEHSMEIEVEDDQSGN